MAIFYHSVAAGKSCFLTTKNKNLKRQSEFSEGGEK